MIGPLLDHLWQSTLFAGVAGLFTLMLKNNSARMRFWLWFAASVKFLLPFAALTALGAYLLAPLASPVPVPDVVRIEPLAKPFSALGVVPTAIKLIAGSPAGAASSHSAPRVLIRHVSSHHAVPPRHPLRAALHRFPTGAAFLALWLAGFLILARRWLSGWLRMRELLHHAVAAGIDAPVTVKFSGPGLEPGLSGIWRPVILLPLGIETRLSPPELKAILAHELCHWRRHDNLFAAIHMLVEALFWFFPLVWWLGKRLATERERACDEAVLAAGNDPQTYAESILKACHAYLQSPLPCVAGVSGADLKERIATILENKKILRLDGPRKFVLGMWATAALAIPLALGILASPAARIAAKTAVASFPVRIAKIEGKETPSFSSEPASPARSDALSRKSAPQMGKEARAGAGAAALRLHNLSPAKDLIPLSLDLSGLLAKLVSPTLVVSSDAPAAPAPPVNTSPIAAATPNCAAPKLVNSLAMEKVAGSALMTVAATIDGSPENLLIGTGAVSTEVWNSTAAKLDLAVGDQSPPWDFAGRLSDGGAAVRRVTLGSIKTGTVSPVVVMPDPDTDQPSSDGMLGTSMMKEWDIDLDFAHRRLNYFSPEQCEGAGVYWNPTTITSVPMAVQGPLVFVPVTLDGRTIIAMLDTSADRTFLNPRVASALFGLKADTLQAVNLIDAEASIRAGLHKFSRLEFGGLTATNARVAIPFDIVVQSDKIFHGDKAANRARTLDEILPDMVIGMDLLKYTHLYISFQNQRVYISAAGEGPALKPAVIKTSTFNVGSSPVIWPVSRISQTADQNSAAEGEQGF